MKKLRYNKKIIIHSNKIWQQLQSCKQLLFINFYTCIFGKKSKNTVIKRTIIISTEQISPLLSECETNC